MRGTAEDVAIAAARVARAIGESQRYECAWPIEDGSAAEAAALRQVAAQYSDHAIAGTGGTRRKAEGFGGVGRRWHVTVEYPVEEALDGDPPRERWVAMQYNMAGNPETGRLARGESREPADEDWPETVRWLREALGVTAGDLARLVGTDDRQVRRWMAGKFLPAQSARRTLIRLAEERLDAMRTDHRLIQTESPTRLVTIAGQKIDLAVYGGPRVRAGAPGDDIPMPRPYVLSLQSGQETRHAPLAGPLGQDALDELSDDDIMEWWRNAEMVAR